MSRKDREQLPSSRRSRRRSRDIAPQKGADTGLRSERLNRILEELERAGSAVIVIEGVSYVIEAVKKHRHNKRLDTAAGDTSKIERD